MWLQVSSNGQIQAHELELNDNLTENLQTVSTIKADITDGCNLRCKFCPNHKALNVTYMKLEAYKILLSLLPKIRNSFLISCMYEPTIHPLFKEFILMVPKIREKKSVYFTTNLTTDLSDDVLEAIAHCNCTQVNISLDTLDPKLYPFFRIGASHEKFIRNLTKLVSYNPTHLRFITLVFKYNLKEIVETIKACQETYAAVRHEVRLPQLGTSMDGVIDDSSMISYEEWRVLSDTLKSLPYPVDLLNERYQPFAFERFN